MQNRRVLISIFLLYFIATHFCLALVQPSLTEAEITASRKQLYALQDALDCTPSPTSKLQNGIVTGLKVVAAAYIAYETTTAAETYTYTPTNTLKMKSITNKTKLLHHLNRMCHYTINEHEAHLDSTERIQHTMNPTLHFPIPNTIRLPASMQTDAVRQQETKLKKEYAAEAKRTISCVNIALFIITAVGSYYVIDAITKHTPTPCRTTLLDFFDNWQTLQPTIPPELLEEFTLLHTLYEDYNLDDYLTEEHARSLMMLLDMRILILLEQLDTALLHIKK